MKIFDRNRIKFLPLSQRENKITIEDVFNLDDEIPEYFNPDLEKLAYRIIEAREKDKPVIWMMGAHPIRRGNSRFIIDLMKRGFITHIATNFACAIHDFELAAMGGTCEDVEKYVKDGKFGNWTETGFYLNKAAEEAYTARIGLGEGIGNMNANHSNSFYKPELSIFLTAYCLEIPITVHKGIGYDITDQSPYADYAALGWASGRDFLIFADAVSKLEGGVFLNIGTQVMGPEVYLKALSMARNVAAQKGETIKNFTTAVFDIVYSDDWTKEDYPSDPAYYFRPKKTILIRTVKDGGESFYIRGDFRVTIPNLHHLIIKMLKGGDNGASADRK